MRQPLLTVFILPRRTGTPGSLVFDGHRFRCRCPGAWVRGDGCEILSECGRNEGALGHDSVKLLVGPRPIWLIFAASECGESARSKFAYLERVGSGKNRRQLIYQGNAEPWRYRSWGPSCSSQDRESGQGTTGAEEATLQTIFKVDVELPSPATTTSATSATSSLPNFAGPRGSTVVF